MAIQSVVPGGLLLLLLLGFTGAAISSEPAAGAGGSPAEAEATAVPEREKFPLYLLIGQSNMAGRGKMTEGDRKAPARVLKFTKQGTWVPAADPLHFDKPRVAGVGPGSGFGPAMAAASPQVTIGLIPCAVGGTPLNRWEKGGDLYAAALRRAKAGMESGQLKGILWHQGESDTRNPESVATYGERLAGMVRDLREDLGAGEVPFVCGELGHFLEQSDRYPHAAAVNAALREAGRSIPQASCVSAEGIRAKSDGVHFDAASARLFGQRYARAMLALQKKAAAPTEDGAD
ncbi:MAG: sialate O-acetylesterase [Planctomycetaceae bacterium]|nr:sialate O-acetylesterase [Planctomycetaceae bacterium]